MYKGSGPYYLPDDWWKVPVSMLCIITVICGGVTFLITYKESLLEAGREEIIEEVGQCDAGNDGMTVRECALRNGWDLKNG